MAGSSPFNVINFLSLNLLNSVKKTFRKNSIVICTYFPERPIHLAWKLFRSDCINSPIEDSILLVETLLNATRSGILCEKSKKILKEKILQFRFCSCSTTKITQQRRVV